MMKKIVLIALTFAVTAQFVSAQLKPVAYQDGNQKLTGLSIQPKTSTQNKAGILVLPAWMGIDAHAKETAENLAKLGYYAFVADIYGEGNYQKTLLLLVNCQVFIKKIIKRISTASIWLCNN